MTTRPTAVRRAVEEAERLAREAIGKPETEEEAEEQLQTIESSLEEEPPAGPADTEGNDEDDSLLEIPAVDDTPELEPQPESDPSENSQESLTERLRIAEERYTTLQAKYNAEVPRLAAQLKRLKGQNQTLRDRLVEVHNEQKQAKVKAMQQRMAGEYDEGLVQDLTDLVQTITSNSAPDLPDFDEPVDDEPEVDNTNHEAKIAQLEALVPNWEKIQEEPGCQEFLQKRDVITGKTYHQILNESFERGNLMVCKNVFAKYQSSKSRPAVSDDLQPGGATSDTKREVPKSQGGKRIWKLSEINRIEAAARQGRYRGQLDKLRKLRDEFGRAAAEGRVDHGK